MKLYLAIFALIATATADVSHLSREYLPPVQHDSGASLGGPLVVNVGSSAGASASAGHSGKVSHSSHQESVKYGNVEPQAAEPAASAAPAVSSGSYSNDEAEEQNQGGQQEQAQVSFGSGSAGADAGAGAGGANVDAGNAGVSFGASYDLNSQDAGVQDLGHNSLVGDSYGSNAAVDDVPAHVGHAAAQGPAVGAPQSAPANAGAQDAVAQYVSDGASASSGGIETQYGANGGYIY